MAVKELKFYTQKDGREIIKIIFKPTKRYPNGFNYGYVDVYFESLVKDYSWRIDSDGKNNYIKAEYYVNDERRKLSLHQEIAFKCLNRYCKSLDHENGISIDNICSNLTEVTQKENRRNTQKRGYLIGGVRKSGGSCFEPKVWLDGGNIFGVVTRKEDEVCLRQFYLEEELYNDYNYNFLKDRRGDLDILDMERCGKISSDEATLLHVKRYVEQNPWYAYRYNLFDYCKNNRIIIPNYSINTEGRMVHHITGELLCPFKINKRRSNFY